jgi:hypothetical protein
LSALRSLRTTRGHIPFTIPADYGLALNRLGAIRTFSKGLGPLFRRPVKKINDQDDRQNENHQDDQNQEKFGGSYRFQAQKNH